MMYNLMYLKLPHCLLKDHYIFYFYHHLSLLVLNKVHYQNIYFYNNYYTVLLL